MTWYYAEAGQQRGPVDEVEFAALIQAGTIADATLVWREGMPDWRPYGEVKPAPGGPAGGAGAVGGTAAGGLVCSQCGRTFREDEVVRVSDRWVCAECKPVFLQRVREGAALGPGITGQVSAEQVLARDYDVDLGGYLSGAWAIFSANAGLMIGATVLVYLVLMGAGMVPYLRILLSPLLTGPLMGGLWLFYVKRVRGEEAALADAFSGFGPRFIQLMLTSVVSTVLTYVCLIPAMMMFGMAVAATMAGRQGGSAGAGAVAPALMIVGGIIGLVGMGVLMYLAVSWMFAFPLVLDKRLNFWPALQLSRKVVGRHWWMTLWLAIVVGVLAAAGALACLVGLFVSAPVAFCMLAHHYQKVFGDMAPAD